MGARTRLRAAVAGTASLIVVLAGVPSVAAAAEPEAGALWGYVAFDDTDQLAGEGEVRVEADQLSGPDYTTETDSTGRFVFNGLPAGVYNLKFYGPDGYPHQYYQAFGPTPYREYAERIDVPTSGDPITMRLSPYGLISGRVSLGSAGSWAGAGDVKVAMRYCTSDEDPCSSTNPPLRTTLTEADGTFAFRDVAYGNYSLSFDYLADDGAHTDIIDDRFTDVRLSSRSYLSTNHDVVMPAAAYLAGTITLDGEPAAPGDIQLSLPSWIYPGATVGVDEEGSYRFGELKAGSSVTVTVDYLGDGDYLDGQFTAFLGAAGSTTTKDFDLVSGGRLSGRVTDSSGAGFMGYGVVRVYRERDYGWYSAFVLQDSFNLDDDGEWSITKLPAGNYEVRVGTTSCGGTTWCYSDTRWRDPATGSYSFTLDEYGVRTDIDITMYRTGRILGEMVCAFCSDAYRPISDLRVLDEYTGAWEAMPYRGTGYSIPQYHVAPGTYMVEGGGAYGVAPWGTGPLTLGEDQTIDLGDVALQRANFLVRTSTGTLYRYPAVNGRLGSAQKLSTAYGQYTKVVDAGDVNHDGFADLYAVDKAGVLFVRPGMADGKFGAAIRVSSGWKSYKFVLGFPDLTGDGHPDLVAQGNSATLYLFPGDGRGGLGERRTIGSATQWKAYNYLAVNGNELIARGYSGKTYVFSPSVGGTAFDNRRLLTSKWGTVTQILAVGGFDGDGWGDVVVRTSAGSIVLWRGNPDGSFGNPITLAKSWWGRLLI